MKANILAAAAAALLCASAQAATVTWTGNAGDNLWGTAGNWSGNAVPTKDDDVSVGDNVTITANATTALPKTLTLGANSQLVASSNELQFWGATTITGGSVTGNLLAAQQGGSSLTISDCALVNKSTGWDKGWYRNGDAHVNFVLGSSGAASYTFRTSLIDNGSVYGTFVSIANPYIKFEGAAIASETDFNETFMITEDAEAGTTTVSLMPLSGWVLSTPVASGVTSSSATLSSTLRHLGEGSGTIVFAYATSYGDVDLANGEVLAGTLAEDATFTKTLTGLTDGTTYYFAFGVKVNGEIVGQSAIGSFFASDYSAVFLGGVDNSWNTPGNWTCGRVPTTSDTILIPAGKSCERGDGLSFVNYDITIDGGSFTSRGEINPGPRKVLNGGTLSATTYVDGGDDKAIVVRGSDIVSTRSNDFGLCGFYGGKPHFNFLSGAPCTYTYNYDPAGDPPAFETEFDAVFKQGQIVVDGKTLTDEDADRVTISTNTEAYTVTLTLAKASYALTAPTAANVTSSSATLSTSLRTVGEGAGMVVFSYATSASAIDLAHGGSLGAAAVEGAVFSTNLTGLVADTLYHYAFGVVTGGVVVAQTAVKTFFASDYSAIFLGEAGDGLAATAGNWSSGSVPTDSDTILIKADCTWLPGNLNLATWNVTVDGASLTVNGEVNQTAARTIRNGALSATVFVGSGNAIEVRGSDITATTTGRWIDVPRGFYATAPFFNFHSGAPCSYTYAYNPEGDAPDAAVEFTALFANGRILVDGAVLTDASRVTITTNTTDHTMTATLLASAVTASFEDAASATVNGLAATLSVTVEVGGGHALYALVGDDPANLTATLVAAEAADATTYTFAATGAEGALTYYQFRLGDGADAIYDSLTPQSFFATANGNVWLGTVSSLASVPANWSKGVVPGASDAVYVVKEKAIHDLEWNIADTTVASWKQIGNVTVTFQTTTNSALSVTGDVDLRGGEWRHAGPSETPDTAINVSVGGDMTVAVGASISAGSRGYRRGAGPGYLRTAGGSFAGEGGHITNTTGFVSYGSILDPLSYGSGGWGDGASYAGGGIVKLSVDGTLMVNGAIQSRGFGYPLDGAETIGGAGSGGSVNISAGALAGTGRIDANGGANGLYGPGSGGRVKIALSGASSDFAGFTGVIEAVGGYMQNAAQAQAFDLSPAAAGTICLQPSGVDPVVRVFNEFRYADIDTDHWRVATGEAIPSATHIPSMDNGDLLSRVHWELSGHGALRVTRDVRTYKLSLASDDGSQCVYTDGHVMTVKELTIGETSYRAGRYTATELPGIVVGTGAVVVDQMPMVILFR